MKKIIQISTILIFLLGLYACEKPSVTRLKKEVERTNSYCPINGGISGDLLSVKYNQDLNDVKFYYSLNEEYGSIILLKKNREYIYSNMRLMLQNSKTSDDLIKMLVGAKASLTLIYKTSSSGKTTKFHLSNDEIEKIYNLPVLTAEETAKLWLSNSVAIQNETCPQKVDEGMYMERVELIDDNIVYYCSMDENLYSIDIMKKNKAEMYKGIRDYFETTISDPSMKRDVENIITLNLGCQFRYYGKTTKRYLDIIITPEELNTILQNHSEN